MNLKNKKILVISPQHWGKMFLAKHHYAIELARFGNEVYFLNPPVSEKITNGVEVIKSDVNENLFLINHSLYFPYQIKFKWKGLFHFLMKYHINKIENTVGKNFDIIWSFDLGDYYPFKYFSKNAYKIFYPIDEPLNKDGLESARGCQIIFSVTNEILEKYNFLNVPKYFMHHGLAEEFINVPSSNIIEDTTVRVGMSGNWLRSDIDRDCLLQIINENDSVVFEMWGAYKVAQSNIGGLEDASLIAFINKLQASKNVILHGPVHPSELATEFQRMDAFLITYDILKDQSKGTNYHKVMEYLSTGKVVITNNITTYAAMPNLMTMNNSRVDNNDLPSLFKTVINNLEYYNQSSFVESRKTFAAENVYANKIKEIEKAVSVSN